MRNPAALIRGLVWAKFWRTFSGVALLSGLGFGAALAEPGAPEAIDELRAKGEQDDAEAANTLGNAYTNGLGVKLDYGEAVTWYRRAATKGFVPAQFNLGLAYELGRGVPVDERQAFKYYLMAAEQGYGTAQFNVGNMYATGRGTGQDLFEAALWYKQAAEKGLLEAQFNLGLAYEAGRGVRKDEAQAARWYRQAAERGFVRAQYNLGLLLEDGRGGAKDEAAAVALYRSAAEQDFASAQNNYGLMFSEGRGGLPKDPVQAYFWLSLAAQNGAGPAARNFVAQGLTADQLAAGARLLAERKAARASLPLVESAPGGGEPAEIVAVPLSRPAATGTTDTSELIEQLREQARRLSDQVQTLLVEKEAASHTATVLAAQVKDLEQAAAKSVSAAAADDAKETVAVAAANTVAALQLAQWQEQVQSLQREKTELDQWAESLEKTLNEKSAAVLVGAAALAEAHQKITSLQKQLTDTVGQPSPAESNQALETSLAAVAELTAENDRLGRELAAARAGAQEGEARRAQSEQLARDNEQLTAFMTSNRRDLDQARDQVTALEKQLEGLRSAQGQTAESAQIQRGDLTEANQAIEKLHATVAELTATNDKLEKDLESARKSTAAALAAQSQAVSDAQPDAYKMEIATLQANVKELEGQIEEERNRTAKDVATLAAQLLRTRETNKSLTEANRTLVSAKENDLATARDNQEQLEQKVRDLTARGLELRRQNLSAAGELQKAAADHDAVQSQLADARKVATVLPGLVDEKIALQERLETEGAQLAQSRQELESTQQQARDFKAQLAASRLAAEKAQADAVALEARVVETEKMAESHHTSVVELTQTNFKLEQEREDLRRQVESAKADSARLLESGRAAQARAVEVAAAQERERAALVAQLRRDNGALQARLTQAQGTLDQIAATARLGTPASSIASGSAASPRAAPVASAADAQVRYHTVGEGDSLSRISMRYYGTPNRWQEIFQSNRDLLQGSSTLRIGMQLRIP